MPLSCAVLPSFRILDIPCVRHIGLNSHKGHNGARAPVMSQKGIRLNRHKGHQGAQDIQIIKCISYVSSRASSLKEASPCLVGQCNKARP
jgi:hypothetical protein